MSPGGVFASVSNEALGDSHQALFVRQNGINKGESDHTAELTNTSSG